MDDVSEQPLVQWSITGQTTGELHHHSLEPQKCRVGDNVSERQDGFTYFYNTGVTQYNTHEDL